MKSLLRALAFTLTVLFAAQLRAQSSREEYQREFRRGYDALVAGKYEEGIASMKRCLELQPGDSTPAYNLACAYSLTKQLDTAFEWLDKSIDLGFVFSTAGAYSLLSTEDKDLAALRADPRFAASLERCKTQMAAVDAFVAQPAVYVPKALESAEQVPLLVVLHDAGDTKDKALANGPWKALADELGYALVLPSGRVPLHFAPQLDPAKGMTWTVENGDYAQNAFRYEKPVTDAVSAFRKQRKLDPARVHIVGLGAGAALAFNLAMSQPGLYKGVVTFNGAPEPALVGAKAANAAKLGLKATLIFPQAPFGGLAVVPPATYSTLLTNCERFIKGLPIKGSLVRAPALAEGESVPVDAIRAALKAFDAPAEVEPSSPAAPADKGQ